MMIDSLRCGAWLLPACLLATSPVCAQTDSGGRIAPEGPYRSKVRVLPDYDETRAARDAKALLDSLRDDQDESAAYAQALLARQAAFDALEAGNVAAAIQEFEYALGRGSLADAASAQLHENLFRLYLAQGDYAQAIEHFEAPERPRDDPELLLAAGQAYLRLGRHEAAIAPLARLVAARAGPDELRLLAHAQAGAGRYADCSRTLRRVLAQQPGDARTWQQLAAASQAAGDATVAIGALEVADALEPLPSAASLTLAQLHRVAGSPYLGAAHLERALSAGRVASTAATWRTLADAWTQAGADAESGTALQRLAEFDDRGDDHLRLGYWLFERRQYDLALKAARRALRLGVGPRTARAHLLAGETLFELGRTGAAGREFRKASEYGGAYRDAQRWLDYLESQPAHAAAAAAPAVEVASAAAPDAPLVLEPLEVQGQAPAQPAAPVVLPTKTVAAQRLYAGEATSSLADLAGVASELGRGLGRAVRRERLPVAGNPQVQLHSAPGDLSGELRVEVGLPVRYRAPPRGKFRTTNNAEFHCVYRDYSGPWANVRQAWEAFLLDFAATGLAASGEARMVIKPGSVEGGHANLELQIGLTR